MKPFRPPMRRCFCFLFCLLASGTCGTVEALEKVLMSSARTTTSKHLLTQDPPPAPAADHAVDGEAYSDEWHKEFRDENYPSSSAGKEHYPHTSSILAAKRESLPWGWGSAWFWIPTFALVGLAVLGTTSIKISDFLM
ncbi:unnamed protein product [Amoebophrya sp. A120]|nr:unnamed protein product [Amoebophrya sp. A120]|eukprot:GSA120T00001177001.1